MAIVKTEKIGNQTLILGDCLQVMPTLGRFDAVVTDPPYGYGYKPSRNGSVNSIGFRRNFGPEHKLIGDSGKMDFDPRPFLGLADQHIWWGGNCFADKLPNEKGWLVWFKADGNTKIDQGHAEVAWTNLGFAIRGINHRWCGMVRDSEHGRQNVHPTQKPIVIMEWCLGFVPEAVTILDPFAGSGTTLVACQRLGRHGTGIERDPDYFEAACRRVDEAARQPDLFIEDTKPKPEQTGMDL